MLLLAALFLAMGDAREFLAVLRQVRPLPFAASLAATGIAYASFHATILAYARASGMPLPPARSFPATFVSHAVNNLVSSGGVGGTTLRVIGYSRLGATPGAAAAVSVMATLAGDLVVLLGVLGGLFAVAAQGRIPSQALWWSGGAFAGVIGGLVAFQLSMKDASRRAAIAARLRDAVDRIAARLGPRLGGGTGSLARFHQDAGNALGAVLARPRSTLLPLSLAALDFVARAGALAAAFAAVGHPIAPSVALTGFCIGIAAGALSFVPGGVGVVEGTMSAVFVWLGVPLPIAAAGVVVFRFGFYVAPLSVALVFSRSVVRPRS